VCSSGSLQSPIAIVTGNISSYDQLPVGDQAQMAFGVATGLHIYNTGRLIEVGMAGGV
jgi:hypothetical protein